MVDHGLACRIRTSSRSGDRLYVGFSHFGSETLCTDKPYRDSVRALTMLDSYKLSKEDLTEVCVVCVLSLRILPTAHTLQITLTPCSLLLLAAPLPSPPFHAFPPATTGTQQVRASRWWKGMCATKSC